MNVKQTKFCVGIAKGLTVVEAVVNAGYKEKSAHSQGSILLKKPEIQQRIAEIAERDAQPLGIDPERILKELGDVAFADTRQLVLLDAKFRDKVKALELLGKHFRMFADVKVHDIGDALGAALDRGRLRAGMGSGLPMVDAEVIPAVASADTLPPAAPKVIEEPAPPELPPPRVATAPVEPPT